MDADAGPPLQLSQALGLGAGLMLLLFFVVGVYLVAYLIVGNLGVALGLTAAALVA